MKRLISLLGLTIAFLTTVNAAQDPKALTVLDKAYQAYLNAGGIKANFSLQLIQTGGQHGDLIKGMISLKGKKFKIEVEDMITWFDGNNQWVYLKKNQEVNVSNPTEQELLMINPLNVFQLYRHGYTCTYRGEKTEKNKKLVTVLLKPEDRYSQLVSIEVSFEKSTSLPMTIVITNKDKSGSVIIIQSYQTHLSYPDSLFVFPQKDYPNTEVIDLR